jgi:hypothetical protein
VGEALKVVLLNKDGRPHANDAHLLLHCKTSIVPLQEATRRGLTAAEQTRSFVPVRLAANEMIIAHTYACMHTTIHTYILSYCPHLTPNFSRAAPLATQKQRTRNRVC